MKNQAFHFEVKDLITMFVHAFDDIVIKRYDKNRNPGANIQVRYVYAPKQRVMYDLVNKAQNITLPVVAVSINSISRDQDRVFNKIHGFISTPAPREGVSTTNKSVYYASPVPINIGINMSILAKFQSDIDQIISNFVPYNNPYIILSWKIPSDLSVTGFATDNEIRSEVLWDGNIALSYPTDISAFDKYRVVGDTTFVIKGWLFPAKKDLVGNIFYINSTFTNENQLTNYNQLSSNTFTYPSSSNLVNETEFVNLSGYPQLTNLDYTFNN